MNTSTVPFWLIRLAVIVALPTIACFGYYSLDYVGQERGVLATLTVLAYPTAIVSSIGVVAVLLSRKRSRALLWLTSLCLAGSIAFLLILRI